MFHDALTNYLRTYRRRAGLSQEDLAFLIGLNDGTISRFESGERLPSLRVALALSAIYQASTRSLFQGEAEKVEASLRRRAQQLLAEQPEETTNPRLLQKKEVLQALIEGLDSVIYA